MAMSFLYLMARRLAGLLLGRLRSEHAKDVEIAVLRRGDSGGFSSRQSAPASSRCTAPRDMLGRPIDEDHQIAA